MQSTGKEFLIKSTMMVQVELHTKSSWKYRYLKCSYTYSKKVKQSHYTPWRRFGGEEL
jgi:hypothetical protein